MNLMNINMNDIYNMKNSLVKQNMTYDKYSSCENVVLWLMALKYILILIIHIIN